MSGDVTASVVANFDQTANVNLSIEGDPGIYSDGFIHLLLHPTDPDISVYASVGEVFKGDSKPIDVKSGIVTFSGSAQAQLPKRPVYSTPEFQVLFAFDAEAQPVPISVKYDAYRNVLSASRECTAAVKYSAYVSASTRLTYKPKTTTLWLGIAVEYGTLAAFKAPNHIVTFDVESVAFGNTPTIELYRIVSDAVTTPEGEFEKPPNYPNDGNYPGLPAATIDVSTAMLTERVHEIGWMDYLGRGFVRTLNVPKLEPYVGDVNYSITTRCKVATINNDNYPMNLQLAARDHIKSRGLGCN